MIRQRLKWWLFPGVNLHARLRNRVLPGYFGGPQNGETRVVLDAGCGNGMLAYQSYLRGNRVLGISIKPGETERNERLFHEFLGIPRDELSFRPVNIYDVESLGVEFDEIICTEVLEHLNRDEDVCRSFYKVLKPGGVLHLCCPNAEHPDHHKHELDPDETGGHVRPGYTFEGYRQLLVPIGFRIERRVGLGGPLRQACNKRITWAQEAVGLPLGLVIFVALWAVPLLDRDRPNVPYSLYVQATKPAASNDPSECIAVGGGGA